MAGVQTIYVESPPQYEEREEKHKLKTIKGSNFYNDVTPTHMTYFDVQSYLAYAPQYYGIARRLALEIVATGIFVFVSLALLTLHVYDPVNMPVILVVLLKGCLYVGVLALFHRYGAGYINPLVVVGCAWVDWFYGARNLQKQILNGATQINPKKLENSHHVGINFFAFILAQGIGAALGSLLVWACFADLSLITAYGFQAFNTTVFSSGRIFVLDMLLLAFIYMVKIISGHKRKTIGYWLPIIVGVYAAIIEGITLFTSVGLNDIVLWLSAALLSNFGGAGVLSAAANWGWVVFGSNAAAMGIAVLLCMLLPKKLYSDTYKRRKKHM
jgi:glycerol uptake facilitator-like aquaporin